MESFWGSFRSYLISIIFVLLGAGCLIYFIFASKEPEPELIDINPDTGISWEDLSDEMYVEFNANNIFGWVSYEMDENGNDVSRVYFVADYSQQTNSYSHLIGVVVKSMYFDQWDSLGDNVLSPKDYMKTVTVKNYANKLSISDYNDLRNTILLWGSYDVDEIEDMLVHYIISPKVEKDVYKWPRFIAIAVAALGGLMLIGSVIGSIINRY